MSIATTDTATHLVKTDTRRETRIGYEGWSEANDYFRADYLYLRKGAYWKYQDEVDAGKRNGPKWYNGSYYTYVENRNLIEHYAARLELSRIQRERAVSFFLSQDLRKWGIDKRFVAWAICTYLVHSDERDIRQTHPACGEANAEISFRELADGLGLTERQRHRLYGKVQNRFARSRWGEGYINRPVLSMVEKEDEEELVVGTLTPPEYDDPEASDGFEGSDVLDAQVSLQEAI
ncbi:hypothetical protein C474_03720 [Halogeometricum pallidum JCM 14848]|uniref:Uncharacterized protein n=1 Tax=Halogeometricum pallidum JCM 14848 TaxID=1227487 RepID=M0DF23_HALPD|nr:hypothetical protein [Halogeometricum pallidum]ELZ34035.1 hypothetical protein C474_03720 [Halogeometricum pallidum JCM 14848]